MPEVDPDLLLLYAVDDFLEYPGTPSRMARLMAAALEAAKKHRKPLNTWCPAAPWLRLWPEGYVEHNDSLKEETDE